MFKNWKFNHLTCPQRQQAGLRGGRELIIPKMSERKRGYSFVDPVNPEIISIKANGHTGSSQNHKIRDFGFFGKNFKFQIRNSPPAFTLIEIIVVLLIAGALAGVLVPTIGRMNRRQEVDESAKKIKSDLRAMQSQAVSGVDAGQWGVVFDAAANTYQIGKYESGALVGPETRTLPSSVDLVTNATVVFGRLNGLPVVGSGATITVQFGGYTRSVTVGAGGSVD